MREVVRALWSHASQAVAPVVVSPSSVGRDFWRVGWSGAVTQQNWTGGKDRRRRLSRAEAVELYARAEGKCQRCGVTLSVDWHQAHMVAHTNGGATSLEQMQAWCPDCNLRQGATDVVEPLTIVPRTWQSTALPTILDRLWYTGTATVHAAPGAGKTFFAGMIFLRLQAAGLVQRLVVMVPNTALQRQWAEALAAMGIQLDWQPRDGFLEHSDTIGAVTTYQSLGSSTVGHISRMKVPTMLVLDEVHHVGEHKAWGNAVRQIMGDPEQPETVHPAALLNMTGTLFRSSGDRRIGSVRYQKILTDAGVEKYEAAADFSVPAADLIGIELRRPDLYAYSSHVELVDVRSEMAVAGDYAELEEGPQLSTAVRGSFLKRDIVQGYAQAALKMLAQQLETIDGKEPLKLLWIAENVKAARIAAEEINKAAGRNFARLVVSEDPGALKTLRAAAAEKQSCAIVAVRMVTEGFDCPQVSVIAYASPWTATLFLAQMMARAMRVTSTERQDKRMLPAQILIPDNDVLRKAFAAALIGHFHILEVPKDDDLPTPASGGGDGIRMPRYELADAANIDLRSATVLGVEDGQVMADELNAAIALCRQVTIPEVYAPRVAVAGRAMPSHLPLYTERSRPQPVSVVVEKPADPRSLNLARRQRVTAIGRWMSKHVEHDARYTNIGTFYGMANSEAGLPAKGAWPDATAQQLEIVEHWMLTRVREHCAVHEECTLPAAARNTDRDE